MTDPIIDHAEMLLQGRIFEIIQFNPRDTSTPYSAYIHEIIDDEKVTTLLGEYDTKHEAYKRIHEEIDRLKPELSFIVQCAWCQRVRTLGDSNQALAWVRLPERIIEQYSTEGKVSHGMCETCKEEAMKEVEEMTNEIDPNDPIYWK